MHNHDVNEGFYGICMDLQTSDPLFFFDIPQENFFCVEGFLILLTEILFGPVVSLMCIISKWFPNSPGSSCQNMP